MTVQTTFAGGVNPWAAYFTDKQPRKYIRRPVEEIIKRPRTNSYRVRIGDKEYPMGGDEVFLSMEGLVDKINSSNFIVCDPEKAVKFARAVRKWIWRRARKASVKADANFGRVYIEWL